jgi:hypothetical protein
MRVYRPAVDCLNLSKAGWSWGCVSAVDSRERTRFVADAHRGDSGRFVVRADEKLTAFMELESAIRVFSSQMRGSRERGPLFRRRLSESTFNSKKELI